MGQGLIEITRRDLGSLARTLNQREIRTADPQGGCLCGTLSLPDARLVLRVWATGKADLYDPAFGTLNLRVPKVTWPVQFGTRWTERVAKAVVAYLRKGRVDAEPETPKPTPKPTPERELMVLQLAEEGLTQAEIAGRLNVAHTTVRRIVEGRIQRKNGAISPYFPDLDPRRVLLLQRRKAPDDKMVAALRARLGIPRVAAPTADRSKKAATFTYALVALMFEKFSNGETPEHIAKSLDIFRRGAPDTTRVTRCLVGGHYSRGEWESFYQNVEGHPIRPLRVQALAARRAKDITEDDVDRAIREHLEGSAGTA